MELTKNQLIGLNTAIERYKNKERFTVISGYAGSGKSTLVKFIIAALAQFNIDPEIDVCYCAFTGKATQVLQKKGNKNVSTLHKLLYESKPLPNGKFIHIPKKTVEYKVVVVDECSMAPKSLMQILFRHNVYIIALGDPFQLPTINPEDDNHLLDHPHVFLDEIMRQAQDSEIIQLSMKIRNQERIDNFKGKDVMVLSQNELNTGMLLWADQILVATNATRVSLNNQVRQLLGRGDSPEEGDKLICLRNYWDDFSEEGNPLVNGTIGYLKNPFPSYFQMPRYLQNFPNRVDIIMGDFVTETNETYSSLEMDKKLILEGEPSLNSKQKYILGKSDKTKHLVPYEFTYGNAITCHKAQGSQWPKVLGVEERFPFDRTEHARWLYTNVTRAELKYVLIRKD